MDTCYDRACLVGRSNAGSEVRFERLAQKPQTRNIGEKAIYTRCKIVGMDANCATAIGV